VYFGCLSLGQCTVHYTLMHYTLIPSCTHVLIPSCTHTLIHSYTHALMHSCTHALIHSYTHALTHSHILIHTYNFALTITPPTRIISRRYPWESTAHGYQGSLTSNEGHREVHISSDVAFAFQQYYYATHDRSVPSANTVV
jgi:hypothetical protein